MTRGTPSPARQAPAFDAAAIRQDFPHLRRRFHGKPLVYLGNASTTPKPQVVRRPPRVHGETV
jgi:cysteine desulfurase / selenocysteine lyase